MCVRIEDRITLADSQCHTNAPTAVTSSRNSCALFTPAPPCTTQLTPQQPCCSATQPPDCQRTGRLQRHCCSRRRLGGTTPGAPQVVRVFLRRLSVQPGPTNTSAAAVAGPPTTAAVTVAADTARRMMQAGATAAAATGRRVGRRHQTPQTGSSSPASPTASPLEQQLPAVLHNAALPLLALAGVVATMQQTTPSPLKTTAAAATGSAARRRLSYPSAAHCQVGKDS